MDWLLQQLQMPYQWLISLCSQPGFWLQLATICVIFFFCALLNTLLQRWLSQDHLACAHVSARVLQQPEPSVRLLQFAENGMRLQLRVWIGDMENGSGSVRSEINLAIWRSFKANGITMPYPQREITVKNAPSAVKE